ncbi:hypothetical protein AB0N31_30940 [Streptomyces sp. NPDC051051]|uniref:hypothetical protein n=1 Tax=Streptomyces sp. NPDC051051 TaxID=3155666 RepID=UPI0034423730
MTHFPSKRSSRPGVVPVAVAGPVAAPAPVAVAPDTRREEVFVPAGEPNISPQGTGQDRSGTVIVYDTPAAYGSSTGRATVRTVAHAAARPLTLGDDLDEAAHEPNGEQAPAAGTTGDRTVLEDTAFPACRDTPITGSPRLDAVGRVRVRASRSEGDVDHLRGTGDPAPHARR